MNHRTMSAALSTDKLSGEALAFVTGADPKTAEESPASQEVPVPPPRPEEHPALARLNKRGLPASEKPEAEPGLVSVTVRVPRFVPPGLLLAAVDRKLKRQRPWTQQEIVAEALANWLRKHGYLP